MSASRQALKKRITSQAQISESFVLNLFLSISGGFQDAYTYICRDKVFANAQTGNVVLFSMNLMENNAASAIRYLLPVIAFALGIFISDMVEVRYRRAKKIHWRQGILLAEILILAAVAFIPHDFDFAANMLVSFSCALQVQAFRSVSGHAYASTMCIGNLRSGVSFLSGYFRERNRSDLRHAAYYFGIISFFALGAGVGAEVSKRLGLPSILASCFLLAIAFLLMEIDRDACQ